jgi:hypothetical protein
MSFLLSMFVKPPQRTPMDLQQIVLQLVSAQLVKPLEFPLPSPRPMPDQLPSPLSPATHPQEVTPPHAPIQLDPVQEGDTISGLAIKLNLSEKFLLNLNGISGNLYPGMVLLTSLRPSNYPRTPISPSSPKCTSLTTAPITP